MGVKAQRRGCIPTPLSSIASFGDSGSDRRDGIREFPRFHVGPPIFALEKIMISESTPTDAHVPEGHRDRSASAETFLP